MARTETLTIPASVWTELTNADATAVRVQNLSSHSVQLMATATATAPSSSDGAVVMHGFQTLAKDLPLAQLWSNASVRLWALSDLPVSLSVSHDDA
jgi:hypothetical protein